SSRHTPAGTHPVSLHDALPIFLAAYGALPFGFNPPEVWEAIRSVERAQAPSFAQPSSLDAAGELAQRLIELAPPGFRTVTFTNRDRKSTRLNSSHVKISYAVFC